MLTKIVFNLSVYGIPIGTWETLSGLIDEGFNAIANHFPGEVAALLDGNFPARPTVSNHFNSGQGVTYDFCLYAGKMVIACSITATNLYPKKTGGVRKKDIDSNALNEGILKTI